MLALVSRSGRSLVSITRWGRALPGRLAISAAAALALAATAPDAGATWSIVLVDLRTGEIAAGSATCLTGFDLRANTPVIVTGIGAATAQSFVDSTGQNRVFIRDGLATGVSPDDILTGLETFDAGHQTRQYGIADTLGGMATFSGTGASSWAGGRIGSFQYTLDGQTGTIIYAIQGNVLTGPPVVDQAVDAVINTPGSLADKLMAGMQAARLMGGDGRCSCNQGAPDACGSPPTGFDPATDKSAHIAYMMIARAGDTDGCIGIYRVETPPFGRAGGIAIGDVTGDGRPDAIVSGNRRIKLFENTSPAGASFVTFAQGVEFDTLPRIHERARLGDVTGDGLDDLVLSSSAGEVRILAALPGGGFDTALVLTVPGQPADLVLVELNGDAALDIAVATGARGSIAVIFSDGLGGFSPAAETMVNSATSGLVAFEASGDAAMDLAVARTDTNNVLFLINDGAGGFTLGGTVAVGEGPIEIATADLNGDTIADLVTANRGAASTVTVLLATGGAFARTDHTIITGAQRIEIGDLDGNGSPDLATALINGTRVALLINDGFGSFTPDGTIPFRVRWDLQLADFNADGRDDLIGSEAAGSLLISTNLGDSPIGRFVEGRGCGEGDYYLNLNVAFQQASDPDPVDSLAVLFGQWRADHVARPDAVRSSVAFDAMRAPADGQGIITMTVTLRDWDAAPAALATGLSVVHADNSDGIMTIGPVTALGNGVFEVQLTAGSTVGNDHFVITAQDGVRPVVLIPDPTLRTVSSDADLNGDGKVDRDDFDTFIQAFMDGNLAVADLTGSLDSNSPQFGVPDGMLDALDFFYYLLIFDGS